MKGLKLAREENKLHLFAEHLESRNPLVGIGENLAFWSFLEQYQYLGNCTPTPPLTQQ